MNEQDITDIGYGHVIVDFSVYDNKIASKQVTLEKSLHTSPEMILKDIIDTLPPFMKGETDKLTLELRRDKLGRIRIITGRKL